MKTPRKNFQRFWKKNLSPKRIQRAKKTVKTTAEVAGIAATVMLGAGITAPAAALEAVSAMGFSQAEIMAAIDWLATASPADVFAAASAASPGVDLAAQAEASAVLAESGDIEAWRMQMAIARGQEAASQANAYIGI